MERLQRVLASNVLRALQARDHVEISPASADAITDEMEALIAPAVVDLQSDLDRNASPKNETVTTMVERITERLLESDHVDDIHADDRVLRRDAMRAIEESLLGYIRGEIVVDRSHRDEDCFTIDLVGLGYVVASVAMRVDPDLLTEALERAAAAGNGRLNAIDHEGMLVAVELPGGAAVGRLTLEEAIREELVGLVEDELVELPYVEQVLELDPGSCEVDGFVDAVDNAARQIRAATGSAASCTVVDDRTIIATFTPLSDDAAERADLLFADFLSAIERELSILSSRGEVGPPHSGPTQAGNELAQPPESTKKAKQAPKSRRRGKKTPSSRSSQTRSTSTRTPTRKAARRKKANKG